VRGQEAPRYRGKARQPTLAGRKPPFGESPLINQDRSLSYPKFERCIELTKLKIALPLPDIAIKEIADWRRHFVEFVLGRKVAVIEEMELDFREVALVGVRPVGRKDLEDAEKRRQANTECPPAI
jgi:hypothetical protein